MAKGIVYIGGSCRHLMDQSAALVADRIARSIQGQLQDEQVFSYRIVVEKDAHWLSSEIGLDIASIQIAKGDSWDSVIDILEVKYLSQFVKRFAILPPLARTMKAFWLLIRCAVESGRQRFAARSTRTNQGQISHNSRDRCQAMWLSFVTLATIGSVAFWLVIGLTAMFGVPTVFKMQFDDIMGIFGGNGVADAKSIWMIVAVAVFLITATAFRKVIIDPLEKLAVDVFAFMEYQLDDRRFLFAPNAILDAITFAGKQGYKSVDLLSLSLGAVLATDAIFPRRKRTMIWSPPLVIENWITLGYTYDLIQRSYPLYFMNRQPPVVHISGHWINVAIEDDFLGSTFTKEDYDRGICVKNSQEALLPQVNLLFKPKSRWRKGNFKDYFIPLRRVVNHRIYWDDEDARAPTCFDALVAAESAGWMTEIRKCLQD